MPNHITNVLEFECSEKRFVEIGEFLRGDREKNPFGHVDFNTVAATAWKLGVRRYVTEMWYVGNDDTWADDIRFACRKMSEILDKF